MGKWLIKKPCDATRDVVRLFIAVMIVRRYLFYDNQRVVLLTLLDEKILAIDEVFRGYWLVEGCKLLLVKGYTTALYELTHLTLAWEDLHAFLIENLDCGLTKYIL